MSQLQELFNKIEEQKKEQKHYRGVYSDCLKNNKTYQEISDKLKELRGERKQIEDVIKQQCAKELDEIDRLKFEIEADKEAINDLVLSKISKGETVSVTDKHDNEYEPIFNVKFRKI